MSERKILIGIQARSTSTRLPNKIHMRVAGKAVLEYVIDSCSRAVKYLERDLKKYQASLSVALLVPKDDSAVILYKNSLTVIEGDEHDVLSRYVLAQNKTGAEHVVRITSDCIMIPTHVIARHVKAALIKRADYVTNTHYRTYAEGLDCEVISARLLHWLDRRAMSKGDREHVTTLIGPGKPFPFNTVDGKKNICHVIQCPVFPGEAAIKTSIDDENDFKNAKETIEGFEAIKVLCSKNGVYIV